MSSRRTPTATKRIARGTEQLERRAGRDRINGVNGTTMRFRTTPSSTSIDPSSVIHILDKRRYRASVDVLRMPTRRPTREPFHPCPVAVLKDQEA